MENLTLMKSIDEAIKIINKAKWNVTGGSDEIYAKLYRAGNHLNKEIAKLLSE